MGVTGTPLAGLYVYPGVTGVTSYVPVARPVGRTADDGTFALPCPGTPVLLAPWPVNAPAGRSAALAGWAATFVGGATQAASASDAPCSRSESITDVVVQRGSTVAGTASVPGPCDTGSDLTVRLYGSPTLTVMIGGLRDGAEYRVGGLPPGRHTLVTTADDPSAVTVGGGDVTVQDVAYACDLPLPSPTPSPTGSGTGTSKPTPSPSPTGSVAEEPPVKPAPSATPEATATEPGRAV